MSKVSSDIRMKAVKMVVLEYRGAAIMGLCVGLMFLAVVFTYIFLRDTYGQFYALVSLTVLLAIFSFICMAVITYRKKVKLLLEEQAREAGNASQVALGAPDINENRLGKQ